MITNPSFKLVNELQKAPLVQLKKLTQSERACCFVTLSKFAGFNHEICLPEVCSDDERQQLEAITLKVSTKVKIEKYSCWIFSLFYCLQVIGKVILNKLNCRISSNQLEAKIRSSWKEYLLHNAEVHGDLESADYIFLGDSDHLLKAHNAFRGRVIDHYSNDGDIGFDEQPPHDEVNQAVGCSPTKKQIKWYGWDDLELRGKHIAAFKALENAKNPSDRVIEEERLDNITLERNNKMLENIRKKERSSSKQKVFIIAGSDHLIDDRLHRRYNVLKKCSDLKCALVIPKVIRKTIKDDSPDYLRDLEQGEEVYKKQKGMNEGLIEIEGKF